jgi:hypothetical protein
LGHHSGLVWIVDPLALAGTNFFDVVSRDMEMLHDLLPQSDRRVVTSHEEAHPLLGGFFEFFFEDFLFDHHDLAALVVAAFCAHSVGEDICPTVGAQSDMGQGDLIVVSASGPFLGTAFLLLRDRHSVLPFAPWARVMGLKPTLV